jgi:hypothetical protein
MDTHAPEASNLTLSFLLRRSKIVEIVPAGSIVVGLTQTGVCVAFHRDTQKRLCFVNVADDEVVRSLFYNKTSDALITVSVYRKDNFSSLKCRSTPVDCILRKEPKRGVSLFNSESLCWPGFVEFDDVNSKVLTFSEPDKTYKVWDLRNYEAMYDIKEKDIEEVKISPQMMMLIYERDKEKSMVPLKILGIEKGNVLRALDHEVRKDRKIDFIEQVRRCSFIFSPLSWRPLLSPLTTAVTVSPHHSSATSSS